MKELAYLIKAIGGLPVWIKLVLYLLVSAFVVAVAGYFGLRIALFAALLAIALGIFLVCFGLLSRWVRARKEAELRGDFESSPPRPTIDPGVQSRLEGLRAAFRAGLARFQVAGKDPYELPWFILAGESGAGKTEAIRHAGVELPRTLGKVDKARAEHPSLIGGSRTTRFFWTPKEAFSLDLRMRRLPPNGSS